jgi:NAD(P)-dependent dehydrogenase (short-subunit alcohol dehydrogenase family)
VNLAGFFHITRSAIRPMLSQGAGHIVNISTSLVDHADSATPSALASLTKGGLVAVTRSRAIEYAARGVRAQAGSAHLSPYGARLLPLEIGGRAPACASRQN